MSWCSSYQVVQSLSHVWLVAATWITAWQDSLSFTISQFPQTHVHGVDDAIQPSHPLLPSVSSCPQSFPASAPFPLSLAVLHQGPKYWSFSFSISLPMNIQDWFPLRLTGLIFLLSKGFSKVFSSTTIQKLWCSAFFLVQLSHPYITTGKTIALTIQTFVGRVMSLLFNILSRFVIGEGNGNPLQCSCLENPRDGGAWWAAVYGVAHSWTRLKRLSSSSSRFVIAVLPRSRCLLISWLQSPPTVILEPRKI